ncbi:MAG: hypothetical protein ACOC1F_00630 [Myxococcota bacterium]
MPVSGHSHEPLLLVDFPFPVGAADASGSLPNGWGDDEAVGVLPLPPQATIARAMAAAKRMATGHGDTSLGEQGARRIAVEQSTGQSRAFRK